MVIDIDKNTDLQPCYDVVDAEPLLGCVPGRITTHSEATLSGRVSRGRNHRVRGLFEFDGTTRTNLQSIGIGTARRVRLPIQGHQDLRFYRWQRKYQPDENCIQSSNDGRALF